MTLSALFNMPATFNMPYIHLLSQLIKEISNESLSISLWEHSPQSMNFHTLTLAALISALFHFTTPTPTIVSSQNENNPFNHKTPIMNNDFFPLHL